MTERAVRPVVTLHLPLDMMLGAKIMQLVAEEYPGAVLGYGSATTGVVRPGEEPTSYDTPAGSAAVILAEVPR